MEQRVDLKTSKSAIANATTPDLRCIIHYDRNKSDRIVRPISEKAFEKIRQSVLSRQSSTQDSVRLDTIVQQVPDTFHPVSHGVHRWCYQSFTNVSSIQKRKSGNEEASYLEAPSTSKRTRTTPQESRILFPWDRCIFCDKYRIWVQGKYEYLTKCVTETAELSIHEAAESKLDENLLKKIRNEDLIAKEAHYHNACRRNYTRKVTKPIEDNTSEDAARTNAHENAFQYLCTYVEKQIIKEANVERMTTLKEKYLAYLLENHSEFYNPNYKTDKLKDKLIRKFGSALQFWRPNHRSDLVYSDHIPKGQAIEASFEVAASDERVIEDCALLLRRHIIASKTGESELPWPPSSDDLQTDAVKTPDLLKVFLSYLISGKPVSKLSSKNERLVNSYSQDICNAATQGKWKMPKHILLGITLHHLTGSAEIVTLLNRFGHCQSYSAVLELETAMCNKTVETASCLPETISTENNVVTHLCWDNFDLNEETPSGAGTTHSAHGIIIQEQDGSSESLNRAPNKSTERSKSRSVNYQPQVLEPYFVKDKGEPILKTSITVKRDTSCNFSASASDFLWLISRRSLQGTKQLVPGWAGWVSKTAKDPPKGQSTVEYMAPVNNPITENSTVKHIMDTSKEVSKQIGQKYTIVTFDLAVAKKAYAILWQNNEMYRDIIVRLGAFHTLASYLGALGKRMNGSGFAEVIVESGICAGGSVSQIMNGKHYNRAMRVHKLTVEALERLLLAGFECTVKKIDDCLGETGMQAVCELAKSPSHKNMTKALSDQKCAKTFEAYVEFKEKVRRGSLGKTAQFWLTYMDKVWLILRFLRATKENNLDLHITSIQEMCPLYFAYDHYNYARYLTVYLITLLNLEKSHPGAEDLLRKNGFSVCRSNVPASRNAVDITIEQTINRHAKSHGGIVGFSRDYSAYYRWCTTRHARASYAKMTYEMADMTAEEYSSHKHTRSSQMEAEERDVGKVLEAFDNFINPFEVERGDVLFCISSGVPATKEIESDLLEADRYGEAAFAKFIDERLVNKSVEFHSPLPKQKLKTFLDMKQTKKLTSSQKKLVEIKGERNIFGQLVMLSQLHDIDIKKALSYQLGPVPWSLATADGSPMKTDKAKLLHHLEADISPSDRPSEGDIIYICDGNALLQAMTSLPNSFDELADKVFEALPKVERVDFVTDTYKPNSIKSAERRGCSDPFLIKGPKTRIPKDWKSFMCNNDNKAQLVKLLLTEWSKSKYAAKLIGRRIMFACEQQCICLDSLNGKDVRASPVQELFSSQEEADTRLILHLQNAALESEGSKRLIIRSPDTDVFVLLLTFSQDIPNMVLFDTGTGNKRRLIDVKSVIEHQGVELSKALLTLHSFTGCDTTSAFVRQGKIKPKKTLQKYKEFMPVFMQLGNTIEIEPQSMELLEKFVCCMYGKPTYKEVNKLRADLFSEKFQPKSGRVLSSGDGTDLSLLSPCQSSLKMHIKRANYQALIWKSALIACAEIPSPVGNGWEFDENNKIVYSWTESEVMPPELVDILAQSEESDQNNDDDSDGDNVEYNNVIDFIFGSEGS